MSKKKEDYITIGKKYGKLTALSFDHADSNGRRYYLCECDCGTKKIIHGSAFKSGNTKSCGCLSKESGLLKKLPNNKGVINQIILGYKRHAKRRDLFWELEYEDVERIIKQPCYYCGKEKSNIKITKNCKEGFAYNGIDRIDNSIGYKITNVVPCCRFCNYSKSNIDVEDFIKWAYDLVLHQEAMANQWNFDIPAK